jgi:hypothetical protein
VRWIRLRKLFAEEGLSEAAGRKQFDTSQRDIKLDGAFEARLITMACGRLQKGELDGLSALWLKKQLNFSV